MAIGEGNDEARIEAAGKILAGEVSEDVVNLIAGRTEPGPVVQAAVLTAEVARFLDVKSSAEPAESVPFVDPDSTNLKD
jgi:hypothetical protein